MKYKDPTGHYEPGDEDLPANLYSQIGALTDQWLAAAGNSTLQDQIHQQAQKIRDKY